MKANRKSPKKKSSLTGFLNVDFDIHTRSGLKKLLHALEPSTIILYKDKKWACIELAKQYDSAEKTVMKFVELVLSLPPAARTIWNRCDKCMANIGIQSGKEPYCTMFNLSDKAISQLAGIKCGVIFTVYASR